MINQNSMMQMNAMGGMGMMGMGMGMMNPQYFFFTGNSLSLQARLQNMGQQIDNYIDAKITVTGVETKPRNLLGLYCTLIWGMFIYLPLLLMCMNWWKKCVLPVFSIDKNVYLSLGKLFSGAKISNVTLQVTDNTFDEEKAQILYNILQSSHVKGFTFVNLAENYDCNKNEYSNFVANMKPIKSLSHVTSDLRWYREIVTY